jgi:hypothetical protein
MFWILLQQGAGPSNQDSGSEFYCGVCDQSFDSAGNFQQHNNSARHKVNLLAQQVKSSGSFHANLQGLQVAEFDEITGLEVRTSSAIRQATM